MSVFSLGLLLCACTCNAISVCGGIIGAVAALCIVSEIPLPLMLKITSIPLPFITISCALLFVNISLSTSCGVRIDLNFSETTQVLHIFLRSLSASLVTLFYVCTIPVESMILLLARMKIPLFLLELIEIIYYNIFLLFETLNQIIASQKSRNGYRTVKTSFISIAELAASLFTTMQQRILQMEKSLASRNCRNILVIPEEIPKPSFPGFCCSLVPFVFLFIYHIYLH